MKAITKDTLKKNLNLLGFAALMIIGIIVTLLALRVITDAVELVVAGEVCFAGGVTGLATEAYKNIRKKRGAIVGKREEGCFQFVIFALAFGGALWGLAYQYIK